MSTFVQVLIRAFLAYYILFFFTRIMGKREVSQLTFFDYIVGITIGSFTANSTLNLNQDFYIIFPALLVFASLQIITSIVTLKSKPIRKIMEGSYTMLIENGKVLEKNMAIQRINMDELQSMLRQKNVFDIKDVDYAFLETNGKVSVMKKSDKQPVTPSDLKISVKNTGIGHIIVEQGKIVDSELRKLGLTKSWLNVQLANKGYKDINQIMFAQVDQLGNIYVDLSEK